MDVDLCNIYTYYVGISGLLFKYLDLRGGVCLEPKTTIQGELDAFLKREGKTINQFAGISAVNSGTLSSIINGNRPIAMQQLDRITAGMGLPEGAFYEMYIDECIIHSTPDWRRLGPFLHRCAELDKLECIRQVVHNLMDNISYAQALFDTAEEFYRNDKKEAAALLYEGVAESEKYQHSERLALCQYRLFTIALGDNQDINLQAATQFEYFVERLDEADQLDALHALANIYISLHRWSKVNILAEEMERKASIQYQNQYLVTKQRETRKEPARPICFYILYAYLLRSAVCHERGEYERALHYASLYADSGWVREDTEKVREVKAQFQEWAIANSYLHRLMAGQMDVLTEYAEFIAARENEILPALIKIMQAANRYQFNVDGIIERFQDQLDFKEQRSRIGIINSRVTWDEYTDLLCEVAAYYFNAQRYEAAIHYTLKALEYSAKINGDACVLRCVRLFEECRHLATIEDQKKYKTLIGGAGRMNEKKDSLMLSHY